MRNFLIILGLMLSTSIIVYTLKSNKQIATQKFNANVDEAKTFRIDLHKVAASYSHESKANFMKLMAQDLQPSERKLFVDVLMEGIKHDDQLTNEEILKVLKDMKLKKEEYHLVAKAVCNLSKKSTDLRFNQLVIDAFLNVDIQFTQDCH